MNPTTKRLLVIRGLRSMGQGAMVVDLTLYLSALHWSGAAIGGVTTGSGLVGSALILLVGILSDRIGRKPFLLIYEALTLFCAILACFTALSLFLILSIVVAGFGRGRNGGAGPFGPAEQAWLARNVKQVNRGSVFSLNTAIGFIGMALGSILGGIPAWIGSSNPLANYRPIFILIAVISFVCVVIIARTDDPKTSEDEADEISEATKNKPQENVGEPKENQGEPEKDKRKTEENKIKTEENKRKTEESTRNMEDDPGLTKMTITASSTEKAITKRENISLLKLGLVNILNGLGAGLSGPMLAYWFHLKYGVNTATIGTTMAIGFILAGFSSIFNGFLAKKMGMVKSVTWMRVIGSLLMVALPFMPVFSLASIIYVIRGALNRGTIGNRVALSASLTRDKRRGFATSIFALSMRLPSSIGPTISGYILDAGFLNLPLLMTAGLQLVYVGLYQKMFSKYDKKEQSTT